MGGRALAEGGAVAAVALAAGGVFLSCEGPGGGLALDDSWIHQQFARTLSQGGGFAFNAGQPVAGSTAPLWTLLLALLQLLPGDAVALTKGLGLALHGATALMAWQLARICGLGRDWALVAGLGTALMPRLLWGALSGMEIPLYALCATAATWWHLRAWERPASLGPVLLFALATLARPECLLLYPLALIDRCRRYGWEGHNAWHLGVFAAVLAPSLAFNLYSGGGLLPNTYYAKVGGYGFFGALQAMDLDRLAKVLGYYPLLQLEELLVYAANNSPLLALAAPIGLLVMLQAAPQNQKGPWLVPLILISYPLVRGVVAPFKGPTFQHGRYAAHLAPLLVVVGLLGLRQSLVWLGQGRTYPLSQGIYRWGRLLALGLVFVGWLGQDLRYARIYGANVADINRMHVRIGRWLATQTPADAVVATHDIGAIGYFSQRRVLDTVGLITPQILPYLKTGARADEGVLRFLQAAQPDYLVAMPNWYPQLVNSRHFEPIYTVEVAASSIAAGDKMVVYRARWD